jgi:hypothetical protein
MNFIVDSILDRGHASVAGVALQLNIQPSRKREITRGTASNFERVALVLDNILLSEMENGSILANEILINCVLAIDTKSPIEDKLLLASTLVLQFDFITTLVGEAFLIVLESTLIFNIFNGQLLNVAQSCFINLGSHDC